MVMMWVVRIIVSFVLFTDAAQRPARDRELSKEFLAFSRVVVMSSTLALLIAQIDKLVLARLFTLPQFGLYAIALNIASAPGAFCDAYVMRVVFPVYAQMWRTAPSALPSVYYSVRRLPSLLYAFGCGGLVGGAGLLVAVLYDPRYAGASRYIALLAIASTLRLPNLAAAEMMTAVGKIRMTLHANVVRVIWLCSAIPLGFFWFGPLGVVASVGLMEVPAMLYSWFVLRRLGVLDLREELAYLAAAASGATIGYLCASAALSLFPRL
jgi:O-antigen/teichoic acid export membrane protein